MSQILSVVGIKKSSKASQTFCS